MKKLLVAIATFSIPFLLVWMAFILTAFSFDAKEVFQSQPFWVFSSIYWFIWIPMMGFVLEEVK